MANLSFLKTTPENTSHLQPTKFSMVFPTLPFINYFFQTCSIPGVSTNAPSVETPFSNTWRHGDKLVYDALTISALVDEDLRVWEESYNWIRSLTFPKEFPEYVRYHEKNASPYHDGFLTIYTNANIPNMRFKFLHAHPLSLSAINFATTDNAETTMTVDITFRYDRYELERLNT